MICGGGWCEVKMKVISKNFRNFPLGLFLGCVLTLLLVWALDSDLSEGVERTIVNMFGAFVGLLAATLALAGVLTNIENQNSITERNRSQDLAAWRSVLPIALSNLIAISKDGMHAAVRSTSHAALTNEDIAERLEADSKILETLRNCIKSSNSESARWLSVLASRYQVYSARSIGLMNDPHLPNYDVALDWATYHALVEHCFPFARGSRNEVDREMDAGRIFSAFWLLDIEIDDDPDFGNLVRRRVERYGTCTVATFEYVQD